MYVGPQALFDNLSPQPNTLQLSLRSLPHSSLLVSFFLSLSLFLFLSLYRIFSSEIEDCYDSFDTLTLSKQRFNVRNYSFEIQRQIREPRRSPTASKLALLLKLELTTFIASGRFRPPCFALLIRRRFLVELSNRHSVIPIVYFIPWKTLVGILFARIISKFYQEQTLRFFFIQFNGSRV